jgi:ribosomal protein L12E/L44/L45/RPP1/RPP2
MQTTAKTVSKAAQAIASSHAATNDKHDPEDREVHNKEEIKEKNLDKTLADSFPASDPPSTIPNPSYES